MDLDELQSVRDRERQTDKLQQLRETFYADAGKFIQALRDQRERAAERADDPFDAPEVSRLSDEIDTAEQTVEAIYEKRVGKIVKAASFAAADLPAESDGMTAEEQNLFETLVADIKANRQHVLDVLAGETDTDESADESAEEQQSRDAATSDDATPGATEGAEGYAPPDVVADESDEVSAADVMGSGPDTGTSEPAPPEAGERGSPDAAGADSSPADAERPAGASDERTPAPPESDPGPADGEPEVVGDASGSPESRSEGEDADQQETGPEIGTDGGTAESEQTGVERETVRITSDVGDIFGVDEREYDLSTDDVVTLPAANVDPLVERDAAKRL